MCCPVYSILILFSFHWRLRFRFLVSDFQKAEVFADNKEKPIGHGVPRSREGCYEDTQIVLLQVGYINNEDHLKQE